MDNYECVWYQKNESDWWPALLLDRVQCINQHGIFFLNELQPFGPYPNCFSKDEDTLPYDQRPELPKPSTKLRKAIILADRIHAHFCPTTRKLPELSKIEPELPKSIETFELETRQITEECDKSLLEKTQIKGKFKQAKVKNLKSGIPTRSRAQKQLVQTFDEKKTVLYHIYRTVKVIYGVDRDSAQNAALAIQKEIFENSTERLEYENQIKKVLVRLQNKEMFEPMQSYLFAAKKTTQMDIQTSHST